MSGKTAEANRYAILASEILQAFQKEFLHVEKAASSEKSSSDAVVKDAVEKIYYDSGSQASNAIPLVLGMVPSQYRKQVLQHLIDDIHAHHDRLTTGDVGNRYLFRHCWKTDMPISGTRCWRMMMCRATDSRSRRE